VYVQEGERVRESMRVIVPFFFVVVAPLLNPAEMIPAFTLLDFFFTC
jgi:hypothetical protein